MRYATVFRPRRNDEFRRTNNNSDHGEICNITIISKLLCIRNICNALNNFDFSLLLTSPKGPDLYAGQKFSKQFDSQASRFYNWFLGSIFFGAQFLGSINAMVHDLPEWIILDGS